MDHDYENAQEAFLVGRYLKENGLHDTLECFLRETPIKMVPKMPDNMQSLPQILRGFRNLLKDREELKEKRRHMQQYEEILNLLFEELRDVYSFQRPLATSTFTPRKPDNEQSATSTSADKMQNFTENFATSLERQSAAFDPHVNDAQLIEEFCMQNLKNLPTEHTGKIIPVAPKGVKKSNDLSSSAEWSSEGMCDKYDSRDRTSRDRSNRRSEGQPVFSRGQTLEHLRYFVSLSCIHFSSSLADHYNRIREYRRLNRRSKPRFLEKPMSAMSNFVAYSSLPVSTGKASLSECGYKCQEMMLNGSTQKQAREKKYGDPDAVGYGNVSACAALQSAACEESSDVKELEVMYKGSVGRVEAFTDSGFGNSRTDDHIQSGEANLSQLVHGKFMNPGLGMENCFPPSFNKNEAVNSSHQCKSERAVIGEKRQCLERRFHKHIDCGGGLHYKAFLREKFFSTRKKEGTTLHKQGLMKDDHEGNNTCFDSSSPSIEPSEGPERFCRNKNNDLKIGNCTEPVDAVSLASETANLLERLLPLVADPDNMQSFINKLDFWTPRPSPRDHKIEKNGYWSRLFSESLHTDINRAQDAGMQESTCDESHRADEIMEEASIDDDSSVLAELEEAVGQTVDEILQRHVLISLASQSAADPAPCL